MDKEQFLKGIDVRVPMSFIANAVPEEAVINFPAYGSMNVKDTELFIEALKEKVEEAKKLNA